MKIILLGILLPCILANPGLKIHGGQDASRNQFPYQISLQRNESGNFSHFCGGSILSERWILTAAHCTISYTANQLRVVAGILLINDQDIPGQQTVEIRRIINHPSYDQSEVGLAYDIALVELAAPLQYGVGVQAINIPRDGEEITGMAVLSGWGLLDEVDFVFPNNLQYTNVPIISAPDCARWFSFINRSLNLCSGTVMGDEAACSSDSGGPLVASGKVIGVVSFGSIPCGDGFPTAYVRTASFVDWINTNTNGEVTPP